MCKSINRKISYLFIISIFLFNCWNRNPSKLITACKDNDLDQIRILLNKGVDIETEDDNGYTPLIIAAMNLNEQACFLLIDNGADSYHKTKKGITTISHLKGVISKSNNVMCIVNKYKYISISKDYNKLDISKSKELIKTIINNNVALPKDLIESNINLDWKDENNRTALWYATAVNNFELMELLLKNGASLDIKCENNITIEQYYNYRKESAESILEYINKEN